MYILDLSLLSVNTSERKNEYPRTANFNSDLNTLELYLSQVLGISKDSYYIVCNGKRVNLHENAYTSGILHVTPRLIGGKGGFGSMLRAIGAQIEKTTNREACRDLSGRRLRDINEEQRLKNWIAQQAEREREAAERKKKKLERLCQEPKHDLSDVKYDESRSNMTEKMSSSIEQGFKASTSGTSNNLKRKNKDVCTNKQSSKKKKKKLWIDAEEDSDDSSNESANSGSEREDNNEIKISSLTDVVCTDEMKS